jgi:endonuclease-3
VSAKERLPPLRWAGAPEGERVGERRERAAAIIAELHELYPDTRIALHWTTPFQLLVAVILSAQCTDERVNQVTPDLFEAYPTPEAMARAPIDELERLVQPTGFFRQKAKNIRATAERIVDVFDGEVPETVAELATMPGAARKTANVVVSACFPENAEGIAVDTHVQRISRRLGWTRSWEPLQVERDLLKLVDRSEWNHLTHLLIDHGRAVCRAPRPLCDSCPEQVAERCPSRGRVATAARRR